MYVNFLWGFTDQKWAFSRNFAPQSVTTMSNSIQIDSPSQKATRSDGISHDFFVCWVSDFTKPALTRTAGIGFRVVFFVNRSNSSPTNFSCDRNIVWWSIAILTIPHKLDWVGSRKMWTQHWTQTTKTSILFSNIMESFMHTDADTTVSSRKKPANEYEPGKAIYY